MRLTFQAHLYFSTDMLALDQGRSKFRESNMRDSVLFYRTSKRLGYYLLICASICLMSLNFNPAFAGSSTGCTNEKSCSKACTCAWNEETSFCKTSNTKKTTCGAYCTLGWQGCQCKNGSSCKDYCNPRQDKTSCEAG